LSFPRPQPNLNVFRWYNGPSVFFNMVTIIAYKTNFIFIPGNCFCVSVIFKPDLKLKLLFELPHGIILAAWAAFAQPCLPCHILLRCSHVAAEDVSVLHDLPIAGPCISVWKGLYEVLWHVLYN